MTRPYTDESDRPTAWHRKPAPPVAVSPLEVLDLWDAPVTPDAPTTHQGPVAGATIAEAFLAFHNANPAVYAQLVALARTARQRGATRISMGLLFETLRGRRELETTDEGQVPVKLNHNYRALYARMIEARESDLTGFFAKRRLHATTPWSDRTSPTED